MTSTRYSFLYFSQGAVTAMDADHTAQGDTDGGWGSDVELDEGNVWIDLIFVLTCTSSGINIAVSVPKRYKQNFDSFREGTYFVR